ncbi:MAG: hypothetical protein OEW75_09425 [Cyclobacteriaceae bacterium]|nr:hypothetical protein [Cyclobacteriaceae bacterium]
MAILIKITELHETFRRFLPGDKNLRKVRETPNNLMARKQPNVEYQK